MNKSQFNQNLNKIGIKSSNNSYPGNVRTQFGIKNIQNNSKKGNNSNNNSNSNSNSNNNSNNNFLNYLNNSKNNNSKNNSSKNNNSRNNGSKNNGSKNNGSRNNGSKNNGSRNNNSRNNGSKNNGSRNNGSKNNGSKNNGSKNNGSRNNNNIQYDGVSGNNSGSDSGGKNYLLSIFFTIFSVVLLFFVVKLGYYIYVSDCEKKPLVEYLFSMSLEPCGKTADIVRSVLHEEEVFHISDQIYNYESAKCKCKSYGVRFATEQEIIEAYNQGANWCTYGWCEGGKAFYPVQTNYYEAIQNDPDKRNSCNKPGVNGGVFNPSMKFGINCYGIKPEGDHIESGIDTSDNDIQDYCDVDDVKEIVKVNTSDKIVSFNNDKWSKFD